MRFPKITQLDRDQTAIFQGAPPDGSVLIIGPPGTGKSVIAFHRAHYLEKMKRKPRVVMYNKVLARFAANRGDVASGVGVSTLHQWVYGWRKGIGVGHQEPPKVVGNKFTHDWDVIKINAVQRITSGAGSTRLNWGHLIIDEGQDFPPAMYDALKVISDVANVSGATPHLAITVFADENQRLQEHSNSSIEEIRQRLGLHQNASNVFSLKKNYRNSKQIAVFASAFYAGLATGKPDLPSRSGDVPVVSMVESVTHAKFLSDCAEKIARYAKLKRTEEIAVLVMGNRERVQMINKLKTRLEGSGIVLQSYASGDDDWPAENLEFDTPGHLTVLNYQSTKGLEFDAVFIVDPGKLMNGGIAVLNAKMTMYVMCSRARSTLHVMMVDDPSSRQLLTWLSSTPDVYVEESL